MRKQSNHIHNANAAILKALYALEFTADNVAVICQRIQSMGNLGAIRTGLMESNQQRRQRGMKVCDSLCEMHIEQFVRLRLQNMHDDQGNRAVLNTGGKRSEGRHYVWLEALVYEAKREHGAISKMAAIQKIDALLGYRAKQVNSLSGSAAALAAARTAIEDDAILAERPKSYSELQPSLFDQAA